MTLSTRAERICLAFLLLIFTCFTAHGLRMFFSGDDMMNMYESWILNPWTLAKAQLFIWMPVYRPLGGALYRIFYAVFGFHNLPLYVFCWLVLAVNAWLSFPFFKALGLASVPALLAVAVTLVHGSFQDLYLSAGTMYDRFWFLFTVLGVISYARMRAREQRPGAKRIAVICGICILSMDAKESGVALPVLLGCYELLFVLPELVRARRLREWLRDIAPLFSILAVLSLIFVFGRVQRTVALTENSAYRPEASITIWLARMSEYFTMLTYGHVHFSPASAAALLIVLLLAGAVLRNRSMLFGWLFFTITITPVALISSRPGYVLYVPDLGLGLYIAAAVTLMLRRVRRFEMAAVAAATIALTAFHYRNWPGPFPPEASPEKRLTEQFRRDYPTLPAGARLLFVTDDFPPTAYDLTFNLRLMYHDRKLLVHRLQSPADQQPNRAKPVAYEHVFVHDSGQYQELDQRNPAESLRLRILRDYTVGREMILSHRDHGAYIVSGMMDSGDNAEGQWSTPRAKLKFDVYPAPAVLKVKFWLPDYVAKPVVRTLDVLVNGQRVGSLALTQAGVNDVSFPVGASQISSTGFTLVDLNVDKPYKNAGGDEFGVVLMSAGFTYSSQTATHR